MRKYLIKGVFQNQAVVLAVIRKFLNFGLDVEGGRLAQRSSSNEPVLLNIDFRTPRRGHIQGLGSNLESLILVHPFQQLHNMNSTL